MSQISETVAPSQSCVEPIAFTERYANSEHFQKLYREGMSLVEETASYLDGPGRQEARQLDTDLSLAYATESMRLTTRLMQVSSWLLIRRALNDKSIDLEQAKVERRKIQLDVISRPGHVRNFDQLPDRLQHLVRESFRLLDIVKRLDVTIDGKPSPAAASAPNTVANQMNRVRLAFSA